MARKKAITEGSLNMEQEAFCQLYVSGDKEFFGNGVQSYIEVYDPDTSAPNWYKTACSSASQILSNIKVINRINELLEEGSFNDTNADKQLSFLMTQHTDFSNKLGAIREYNKLKQRITDKLAPANVQISIDYAELKGKTPAELDEIRRTLLG